MYRITPAGRKAIESKDASVPSDYRTILWVMEYQGADHVRGLARLFPEEFLSECMAEMEELHLVEQTDGEGEARGKPAHPEPIYLVSAGDLAAARQSLSHHGAYLSQERLKQRAPIAKAPSETTVLIVEDDPDELALADLRVSMAGYVVHVADSQRAMLQRIAAKGIPDLLLLDVVLGADDGFDILSRLRRLPTFARLPIVMLTAKDAPDDIAKGLRLGADGYITKPYSKNILASVIQRILRPAS